MRRGLICFLVLAMAFSFTFLGCGPKKAASAKEAIQKSQTIQKVQDKVNYLMEQANAFYNSKQYQQALDVGQYILARIDINYKQAQDIVRKAKAQLKTAVDKVASETKTKLDTLAQ